MPIYIICAVVWLFFYGFHFMVYSLFLIIPVIIAIIFFGPFLYVYNIWLKKYKYKIMFLFKVLTTEFYYIFFFKFFFNILRSNFNLIRRKLGL